MKKPSLLIIALGFLAVGMVACGASKDNPPVSPPSPIDASLDGMTGDSGDAPSRPGDLADVLLQIDANLGLDDSPLPLTECGGLKFDDPDEALAKVPNMACVGCLLCPLGPPLVVCGLPFGSSVICSCSNSIMSCTDERPNAVVQEAFKLSIYDGALCPTPSWQHDAGIDQVSSDGE